MKVYLDESYSRDQKSMILGAVYTSDAANTYLCQKVAEIKKKHSIKGELKYSKLNTPKKLKAAKEIIDLLLNTKDAHFKGCNIPYSEDDLQSVKGNKLKEKRVATYAYSAKKLMWEGIPPNTKADLFMDHESGIEKTNFHTDVLVFKPIMGRSINSIQSVDSKDEQNCLIQMCDLVTGAIQQNLNPSTTKSSKYKRKLGEFLSDSVKSDFSKNLDKKGKRNFKFHHVKVPVIK